MTVYRNNGVFLPLNSYSVTKSCDVTSYVYLAVWAMARLVSRLAYDQRATAAPNRRLLHSKSVWISSGLLAKIRNRKRKLRRRNHHHHHRLYSPGWALASPWGFVTMFFTGWGLLASRPTPNLEGPGIPFSLGHYPWPVWHARPYH
jgi:hypothetical protein